MTRAAAIALMMLAAIGVRAFTIPVDIVEAVEICDNSDLRNIEGLWVYPEDDVTVLIYRSDDSDFTYGIYVVQSSDCSLRPGACIGKLTASPDPDKFKLRQFTHVKNNTLSLPCDATATLAKQNEALIITKPSLKFSFRPNMFLPSFWRAVRLSVKNPNAAPHGLIKIYPSYDGNGSLRRHTRYL